MSELLATYTSLPNLHPAVVHFPIALLPLALLLDLVAVLRRDSPIWDRLAVTCYALGAAGAALAVRAGEQAADSLIDAPAAAQQAIAGHSDAAHLTLYLFGLLAAARLFLSWGDRRAERLSRLPIRVALLAAGLYALMTLMSTADKGGALVYRYGLAVSLPAAPAAPAPAADAPVTSAPENRLVRSEGGVVTWTPAATDIAAVGTILRPAAGFATDAVQALAADSGRAGLGLEVTGRTLLLLPGRFGDVQVDAELDLTDFTGSVGVAHHVLDEMSRAHFALSTTGRAELVDLRENRRRLLDEGGVDSVQRVLTVGVSSVGRHLKGFLDGRTVVHGHITPGKPGGVGLLLDGSGTVRVLSLTVTPL